MIIVLLLACGPSGPIPGTVIDALTGEPASALDGQPFTLQVKPSDKCDTLTAEIVDGTFVLPEGVCKGRDYAVSLLDGRLVDPVVWDPPATLDLEVWPIQNGFSGGMLVPEGVEVPLLVDVRAEAAPNGTLVRFPAVLPIERPAVTGFLVIAGAELVALPESPDAARIGPWRFIDAKIGSDGSVTESKPTVTNEVRAEADRARAIPVDGLTPGVYGIVVGNQMGVVEVR